MNDEINDLQKRLETAEKLLLENNIELSNELPF